MISTIKKNFVRRLFKLPRNRVNKDQVKDFLGSPEKAFTVTALVFGIMAVIVMPIFMIPDENVHFYRAYHIGEGKLVGQKVDGKIGTYGPLLPPTTIREDGSSIVVPVNQYFKKIKAPEIFTNFPTTSIASPVMYIPQAIGIDMGRIVNGSLGSMVLVGRLMNLAAYILLVVLAIRIAKMGKWVYVVVGLFPVAIQQAGSLSADVMTIGLAFVAIAFIQSMLVQRSRIGRRQIVAIILLGMCLSLTKQNSILLLLPLIFLPKRLFAHGKQKYGLLASVFGASLLSLGLWYGFVHASYDGLSPIVDTGSQNVNPSAQLRHIFEQPLSFLEVLFRTYIYEGRAYPLPDFHIESMHSVFSWLTYKSPVFFVLSGYGLLLIALLIGKGSGTNEDNDNISRLALPSLITFVLSVVAIAGTLYLFWTPVGSLQAYGIQGRYFIPLIPLLIPVFGTFKRWISVDFKSPHHIGILVASVSSINLLVMLLLTIEHFYF